MSPPVRDQRQLDRTRRRFVRRQWARRWQVWKWLVALLLVLGLVGLGGWLVFFSSVLAVKQVTVTGTGHLTRDDVVAAADVPLGRPLARVDLESAASRVRALAPVAAVDIHRTWPDTVSIAITERTPVAVVGMGGQFRALDREGVLFRDYRIRPRGLPVIESSLTADTDTLAEGAQVAAALSPAVARLVDHLQVRTVDDIRLELRDGRTVVWGSADDSDLKAEVVLALLRQPGRTYDVSVPGQSTVSRLPPR